LTISEIREKFSHWDDEKFELYKDQLIRAWGNMDAVKKKKKNVKEKVNGSLHDGTAPSA